MKVLSTYSGFKCYASTQVQHNKDLFEPRLHTLKVLLCCFLKHNRKFFLLDTCKRRGLHLKVLKCGKSFVTIFLNVKCHWGGKLLCENIFSGFFGHGVSRTFRAKSTTRWTSDILFQSWQKYWQNPSIISLIFSVGGFTFQTHPEPSHFWYTYGKIRSWK